jgi:hypothetical protein
VEEIGGAGRAEREVRRTDQCGAAIRRERHRSAEAVAERGDDTVREDSVGG